ncbi:flagellar hook-basal body protein [Bacillus rubiinfantis]|uniref:flagellar hook-basal body protein n=1 Tax=Bacillus rubiinfantis TaxID=1499680 RepID=UPI0005A67966|nr:flagellar hook-basal body protein [Bacillus rubiinfantis]
MNTSLYISSGALQAYQQKLDNTASNIANVDTNGYKRKDHSFSELLANQINNQAQAQKEIGRLTPNGIRVGYGVRTGLTQFDASQGAARQTGNPFDLMINGKGYFQVGYPDSGETHYTRDGSFHLSPNPDQPGSYHLVNANGGYLLDQQGEPIALNGEYDVSFDGNGQILLKNKTGEGTQFVSEQQIGFVDIQNPNLLQAVGNNEFAVAEEALPNGENAASVVRLMNPGEAQISSGYLEGSNVDLSKEMTDLMTSQRSYQMNARAVSYADQMTGIANNILK